MRALDIRDDLAHLIGGGLVVSGAAAASRPEVQVAGRMAYERGTFIQKLTPATGQPSVQRARYLAIWLRQPDGTWRCSRFLFNEPPQT